MNIHVNAIGNRLSLRATQHSRDKPWKDLLIPHDSLDEAMTLAGLAAKWEFST